MMGREARPRNRCQAQWAKEVPGHDVRADTWNEVHHSNIPLLIPLLSPRQRAVFAALSACWVLSLILFWHWWLRPEHNTDSFRYILNCAVLFWTTVIPGYFVLIFTRARVSNPARTVPDGWRVAMIVTKTSSEPFALVQTTLLAMLSQAYPHDTWLADEDPSTETIAWCEQHGVSISTRKDVVEYHNASWPRRTRCKEGNLAYFYDCHGYHRYEFVAQLDADHVPAAGYLEAILLPFADPRVGYVSAPSICDSNAASSWSARGRLHVEAALHGALQAGHNGGLAPLCIGSHYAVRTAALRHIGGLGPELAEDHSTTLIMNAKGWHGVHALNAIASGEGPRTFADMATQEYQWAKSLTVILFRYMPRYFAALPLRLKAQFLFAQLWYPLFSLTMAASVVMPLIALLTGQVWGNVAYASYFVYATGVTGSILLLMSWVKSTGCLRPHDAKIVSWEGFVFLFVRWPWSLVGICSAIVDCARGREFVFRVTPKSSTSDPRPPLRVVMPYLFISLACTIPIVAVSDAGNAQGFYVISAFNGLVYLFAALLIVVAHARENGRSMSPFRLVFSDGPLVRRGTSFAAMLVLALGMLMRLPAGTAALLWTGDAVAMVHPSQVLVGVYDPERVFPEDKGTADIQHIFVTMVDPNAATIVRNEYDSATSRGRRLMVTVEPWAANSRNNRTVLSDIVLGAYNKEIDDICVPLRWLDAPVMIRWAHEMETNDGRYHWESADPASYIAAYRYFVNRCRGPGTKMQFIWSPRGDPALSAYFPGNKFVDYVGLSVFDCPTCGVGPAGGHHSAAKILEDKYQRVAKYNLPVIVAELGIEGTSERRRNELVTLRRTMSTLPLIKAVVYFNAVDTPGAWPWPNTPDWRISPPLLRILQKRAADRHGEAQD
jgi:cellulose synthase (UDP-forming)